MAWQEAERSEILKALSVVCEVTGASFSTPAKMFILAELEGFEAGEVLQALRRCAHECKMRLSLADITQRIEENREKDKANRRALASIEETQLRLAALKHGIPWEDGKERVREMLGQIGKGLPAPEPARERLRERSKQLAAHWQEKAEDREP